MTITLTDVEVRVARHIGRLRNEHAKRAGLKDKHGFDGDGELIHALGAAGEMAFCKSNNLYWEPRIDTFKEADVGDNIQVRTRSRSYYDLLIRKEDRSDQYFVLVTGNIPKFEVVGWIRGEEGKQAKWLRCHGGREEAYFIPQSELKREILANC